MSASSCDVVGHRYSVVASVKRLDGVDRWRGLAILGMVVDHVTIQIAGPYAWWRWLLPWHGLPIFCLLVGYFGRRRAWGKVALWFMVGTALSVWISPTTKTGVPDVLCWLAVGRMATWSKWSFPLLMIALMQPIALPLAFSGYQPGSIVALTMLGPLLVNVASWDRWGCLLPSWFAHVGRRGLPLYVGHLLLVFVLKRWGLL